MLVIAHYVSSSWLLYFRNFIGVDEPSKLCTNNMIVAYKVFCKWKVVCICTKVLFESPSYYGRPKVIFLAEQESQVFFFYYSRVSTIVTFIWFTETTLRKKKKSLQNLFYFVTSSLVVWSSACLNGNTNTKTFLVNTKIRIFGQKKHAFFLTFIAT